MAIKKTQSNIFALKNEGKNNSLVISNYQTKKRNNRQIKTESITLESIPEDLAIAIERTELHIYFSDIQDVNQYIIIKNRLQNIVNNLEEVIENKERFSK